MEKITLQPGVWKRFGYSRFQVLGQNSIRIGFGSGIGPANGGTYEPPAAEAPYFTTQGFNPKVIYLTELINNYSVPPTVYAMPDGDKAVDVVVL